MTDRKTKKEILGNSGLRFFGTMSAANAHEIKNALAVINENAGLLADLVTLADQGASLDLPRLKRLASVIEQQVVRADEIAKSTNRFAHSVDKALCHADLERSLLLVKTMAMRFATRRHISIEVVPIEPAIALSIQHFQLLHLLWLCLEWAMKATDAEQVIRIIMKRQANGVAIHYGPLAHLDANNVSKLQAKPEMGALLQTLNGDIRSDPEVKELVLILLEQACGEQPST